MKTKVSQYAILLRDPKWQKRRLEIMERAGFRCVNCGSSEKELQIHHRAYNYGSKPWEYKDTELECLCCECHKNITALNCEIKKLLPLVPDCYKSLILGAIKGALLKEGLIDSVSIDPCGYEENGVWAAYNEPPISAQQVIQCSIPAADELLSKINLSLRCRVDRIDREVNKIVVNEDNSYTLWSVE